MKKKIPFDISYREKVENGEVSVVTRDDRHVDILRWDANSKFPIVGLITFHDGSQSSWDFMTDGRNLKYHETISDLFLIVEEDAVITEFEALVNGLVNGARNGLVYSVKDEAAILLEAARKALRPEFDKELEKAYRNQDEVVYQRGYDAGFAAGSAIDEERLTDKIAEKVAEKVVKDGNPFVPNPVIPSPGNTNPWTPNTPITPITVMYGVTPTDFLPTAPAAADGVTSVATSISTETYTGSDQHEANP